MVHSRVNNLIVLGLVKSLADYNNQHMIAGIGQSVYFQSSSISSPLVPVSGLKQRTQFKFLGIVFFPFLKMKKHYKSKK